jgi:hypothetical protein
MTIKELMIESHRIALAKGWWEKLPSGELKPRSMAEILCLYHSEVSEALEAYRDPNHQPAEIWFGEEGKPEGFGIEIADLLIRLADSLEARRFDMADAAAFKLSELNVAPFARVQYCTQVPIPAYLNCLHRTIVQMGLDWEDEYVGGERKKLIEVFGVSGHIMRLVNPSQANEFLETCLEMKMTYNEKRPYRHGNKRC